jgi:hypothetical protein
MLSSSGPLVDSCKATDDARRDVQLAVPCENDSITLEAIGQHPLSDRCGVEQVVCVARAECPLVVDVFEGKEAVGVLTIRWRARVTCKAMRSQCPLAKGRGSSEGKP